MTMDYNREIAIAIKKEFDFNDYEIEKEKLIEVSKVIQRTFKNDLILFGKFIDDVHCGKLGMWYKQPVSIISLAYKYNEENKKETIPPYHKRKL